MKVKDIIEALQNANPNFEVKVIDKDGNEFPDIFTLDTDMKESVYIVLENI